MAAAEGLVYGPIHRVLREMEATGRVQRGYFVEGLAGAQFALPGVVGRLRAAAPGRSEPSGGQDVVLLAAADPANPYGAVVPWPRPERADAGLRRVPGAWVVLAAGRPTLYVSVAGRQVHTFPGDPADLGPAFRALLRLPRSGRRGLLVIERVDGIPALSSPYAPDLRACGFVDDYRGLVAAP
jgi:ATP-dependent Lhr-like helicase